MSRDSSLTDKQARFCKEYVVHFNATRAAKASGYSLKTAEKIGSENLKKPEIIKEINRLQEKTNKKLEVSAEKVILELAKIGFVKDNGLQGYTIEFDSKDKIKALEMLARHTGVFNNDDSSKTVINVNLGDKKD